MSALVPAAPGHHPDPPAAIRIDDDDRQDVAPRTRSEPFGRVPVLAITFLAKFTMPPFGAMGLTLPIPVIFMTTLAGALSGRMQVALRRLLVFIAMMCVLWGTQLAVHDTFSANSLLLLTVLHLSYVFYLPQTEDQYDAALRYFQGVTLIIGTLGIAQYALQFPLGAEVVFPIENYLPGAFLVSGFNMQGWLEYGSKIFRANGVFMLEPSFFSQLLALGILIELVKFRRLWCLVWMTAALFLSFSGTGLLTLALCLPVLVIQTRRWDIIFAGLLVGALAIVGMGFMSDVPFVDIFLRRATEFTSKGSSGFARYVGGFYLFEQYLWDSPVYALFGRGAGSFVAFTERATYMAVGTTLFKMVFEFGIVGGAAYFGFLFYCVASSSAPLVLRIAIAMILMLSGIHIPFAHGLALGLLLWNAPRAPAGQLRFQPGSAR